MKCEWLNKDCLKVLKKIPDKSVDLVFTSPPYAVGKDYDLNLEKTLDLHKKVIAECNGNRAKAAS